MKISTVITTLALTFFFGVSELKASTATNDPTVTVTNIVNPITSLDEIEIIAHDPDGWMDLDPSTGEFEVNGVRYDKLLGIWLANGFATVTFPDNNTAVIVIPLDFRNDFVRFKICDFAGGCDEDNNQN